MIWRFILRITTALKNHETKIKKKEIHLHYFPNFDLSNGKVEDALLHFKDFKNENSSLFGFHNKLVKAIVY